MREVFATLAIVNRALAGEIRERDMVDHRLAAAIEQEEGGRHGGDEFLCLITQIQDENNVAMIAGKIIKAIQTPCHISPHNLDIDTSIGASIGISLFPKDGTTADALIKSADEAMYRAKQHNSGYAFAQQERRARNVR